MRKFFKYLLKRFFIPLNEDYFLINCFKYNLSKDEIEYLNKKIEELFDKKSLK